jgi:hypothetical protein
MRTGCDDTSLLVFAHGGGTRHVELARPRRTVSGEIQAQKP